MKGIHVVWFKRDLRTYDHAPLLAAARSGPVVPIFVFEPDLWWQPDMSGQHQWTCARDIKVAHWCQDKGIPWYQWRQDGVIRGLKNRDGWAQHWETFFASPAQDNPCEVTAALPTPCTTAPLGWR